MKYLKAFGTNNIDEAVQIVHDLCSDCLIEVLDKGFMLKVEAVYKDISISLFHPDGDFAVNDVFDPFVTLLDLLNSEYKVRSFARHWRNYANDYCSVYDFVTDMVEYGVGVRRTTRYLSIKLYT